MATTDSSDWSPWTGRFAKVALLVGVPAGIVIALLFIDSATSSQAAQLCNGVDIGDDMASVVAKARELGLQGGESNMWEFQPKGTVRFDTQGMDFNYRGAAAGAECHVDFDDGKATETLLIGRR